MVSFIVYDFIGVSGRLSLWTGLSKMSADIKTFENVKAVILSCHKNSTSEEKVNFYNTLAENYDQVR